METKIAKIIGRMVAKKNARKIGGIVVVIPDKCTYSITARHGKLNCKRLCGDTSTDTTLEEIEEDLNS